MTMPKPVDGQADNGKLSTRDPRASQTHSFNQLARAPFAEQTHDDDDFRHPVDTDGGDDGVPTSSRSSTTARHLHHPARGVVVGTVTTDKTFTIDGLDGADILVGRRGGPLEDHQINAGTLQLLGGQFEFSNVESLTGAATAAESSASTTRPA